VNQKTDLYLKLYDTDIWARPGISFCSMCYIENPNEMGFLILPFSPYSGGNQNSSHTLTHKKETERTLNKSFDAGE
jgi:hypothetical protein